MNRGIILVAKRLSMLHRQLPDDHFDRKEFISDGRSVRLFNHMSIALQVSAVAV